MKTTCKILVFMTVFAVFSCATKRITAEKTVGTDCISNTRFAGTSAQIDSLFSKWMLEQTVMENETDSIVEKFHEHSVLDSSGNVIQLERNVTRERHKGTGRKNISTNGHLATIQQHKSHTGNVENNDTTRRSAKNGMVKEYHPPGRGYITCLLALLLSVFIILKRKK